MGELPSKYSSLGLSSADQKKVITTEKPGGHKASAVSYKLTVRVNEALDNSLINKDTPDSFDGDGDIPMIGMDDAEDVEMVTEYVTKNREEDLLFSPGLASGLMNRLMSDDRIIINEKAGISHLVVDTNFMISHLNIVDSLSKTSPQYNHKIIIPTTVIKELDGLKSSKRISESEGSEGQAIGLLARWANDWIYKQLANSNPSVRAQKLYESIDKSTVKDDAILDCCLYFKSKEAASLVVLLSNDKNLCMKALSNDILTVSYRSNMTAELIAGIIFKENIGRSAKPPDTQQSNLDYLQNPKQSSFQTNLPYSKLMGFSDQEETPATQQQRYTSPTNDIDEVILEGYQQDSLQPNHGHERKEDDSMMDQHEDVPRLQPETTPQDQAASHLITLETVGEAARLVYSEVTKITLGSIDYCMFEEYGEDLDLIGYDKDKVSNLRSAADILIQYYVSVFTEYFSKSKFKPFETRGKKFPKFTNEPRDLMELVEFVDYWSNVLKCLYFKRDKSQNEALEKIIERWEYLIKPFVGD